jgi:hypothetical protein
MKTILIREFKKVEVGEKNEELIFVNVLDIIHGSSNLKIASWAFYASSSIYHPLRVG